VKIGVAGLLIAIICLSPLTIELATVSPLTIELATANSECSTDQQFYGSPTNLRGKREGIISNVKEKELYLIVIRNIFG